MALDFSNMRPVQPQAPTTPSASKGLSIDIDALNKVAGPQPAQPGLIGKVFPNMPAGNLSEVLQGITESAPALASEMLIGFPAGLAAGTGAAFGGATGPEAAEEMAKMMQQVSYQPQTPMGKYAKESVMKGLEPVLGLVGEMARGGSELLSKSPAGQLLDVMGVPKGAKEFLIEQGLFLAGLGKAHKLVGDTKAYYTKEPPLVQPVQTQSPLEAGVKGKERRARAKKAVTEEPAVEPTATEPVVPEQTVLDLGLPEKKPAIIKPVEKVEQGELFAEPVVEPTPEAKVAPEPITEPTTPAVSPLTDAEVHQLERMGYNAKIYPEADDAPPTRNTKLLDTKSPDEWRAEIQQAYAPKEYTPEELAAAEKAGQTASDYAAMKEKEKHAAHQANLDWLDEQGIKFASDDAKIPLSDMSPTAVDNFVKSVKGELPVSKRHAEAKAALDNVMKRIDAYDSVLEADVKEVDPALLDKMSADIDLAIRLAKLSDSELQQYITEKGLVRDIPELSASAEASIKAQLKFNEMPDEVLDAEAKALTAEEPAAKAAKEVPSVNNIDKAAPPEAAPGEVGKARRKRKPKQEVKKLTGEDERKLNNFAMEVGEHLDIDIKEAAKKVMTFLEKAPGTDMDAKLDMVRQFLKMPEAEDMMQAGATRGITEFAKDISEVVGGSDTTLNMFGGQTAYEGLFKRLIKGEGLTLQQEMARTRALHDIQRYSIEADKVGKSVYQYMFEKGVPVGYAKPFMGPFDRKQRVEFGDDAANWVEESTKGGFEPVWNRLKTWQRMDTHDPYKLGDIFDHEVLYDLYPDAKNIKVEVVNRGQNTSWNGSINGDVMRLRQSMSPDEARSVVLHEVMHWIQDREGFASGGSANFPSIFNQMTELKQWYKSKIEKSTAPEIFENRLKLLEELENDPMIFERLKNDEAALNAAMDRYNGIAVDAYLQKAGEIEARTVQDRRWMNDALRARRKIKWGGYKPGEAVVEFDRGRSSSMTLDSLGLQSIYERISDFAKRARAIQAGPTTKLVREIQGENGPQSIYVSDKKGQDVLTKAGEWVRDPLYRYQGTKAEPLVFDLISANQYWTWAAHQSYGVLRDAAKGLSKESKVNVRQVLEGKIEGTAAEQKAAGIVRSWLDEMRATYQGFLREQYKKHLSKADNTVLESILSGEDFLRTAAKARRLNVDLEVAMDIASEYRAIDKWGLDDYVTKVELGRWKVLANVEDPITGKMTKSVVSVGVSKADAIRKATSFLEENPDIKRLELDDSFIAFGDEQQSISLRQYRSIVGKIAKGINDNVEGLSKGIARKLAEKGVQRNFIVEPTKVWSPFVQERRGRMRGEDDIFPVLYSYARSMQRKMNLDPVLDDVRRQAPNLPENIRDGVLQLANDVKGRYYPEDQFVDSVLKGLSRKLEQYTGLEVEAPGMIYSRTIAKTREWEAKLKLGFRPVAAAVNYASGQAHVWAKTGTNYYFKGKQFLNTPEGRKLIHEESPYFGINVVEDLMGNVKADSRSLRMFSAVEVPNREIGIAANYLIARDKLGMSHEAAREFARKANWMQNFTYDVASLPRIMRGPTGRLATQFKPYLVKEMEFIRGLKGVERTRYLAAMLTLAGPRGVVVMLKSLPILGALGLLDNIDEWMNTEYPRWWRGIGGMVGADVVGPATVQLPASGSDLVGPALSDMGTIWTNIIKPLREGEKVGWRDVNKTAADIVPIWKHWYRMVEQLVDQDFVVKNDRGQKLYQIQDAEGMAAFVGRSAAGVESIDIAREKLAERIWNRKTAVLTKNKMHVIDDVLDTVLQGKPLSESQTKDIIETGVNRKSLLGAARFRQMTPEQRMLLKTEIRRRPELIQAFPWAFSAD